MWLWLRQRPRGARTPRVPRPPPNLHVWLVERTPIQWTSPSSCKPVFDRSIHTESRPRNDRVARPSHAPPHPQLRDGLKGAPERFQRRSRLTVWVASRAGITPLPQERAHHLRPARARPRKEEAPVEPRVQRGVHAYEVGDLSLLGAHGLEGLNLRVDLGRKELVPARPVPAAAAA